MSNKLLPISDLLYEYLISVSSREPEVLQRLRAETMEDPESVMLSAPEQGQFMALLAELSGARKCLEVGVYTGYSTLWLALALPENGSVLACDVSEKWTSIARRYWDEAGVSDKISLQLAPALETLDHLLETGQEDSYDYAFIDADKQNYVGYYERVLALLRPGGLMVIDNTLWSGNVADNSIQDADTCAIRDLNKRIHSDRRVHMSLLPVADGLTLVRKV